MPINFGHTDVVVYSVEDGRTVLAVTTPMHLLTPPRRGLRYRFDTDRQQRVRYS